ncbi:Hypothetical predicted protein [Olea europaea subsp. europaea]|uniref:Uncharacterized protein n=1 Tax=Olea europaea subsp. europaea TaxID=158383 RepID=A0A8S0PJ62_OLEEU|nr:Hypothetical predicted protein [Olea europaea subsp. europaea]
MGQKVEDNSLSLSPHDEKQNGRNDSKFKTLSKSFHLWLQFQAPYVAGGFHHLLTHEIRFPSNPSPSPRSPSHRTFVKGSAVSRSPFFHRRQTTRPTSRL